MCVSASNEASLRRRPFHGLIRPFTGLQGVKDATFIIFYYKHFLLSGITCPSGPSFNYLLISYVNIKNVFMKLFF